MTPDELRAEAEASKARRAAQKVLDFKNVKPETAPHPWGRKCCPECGARLKWMFGSWAPCALCKALASGDVSEIF